MHIRVRGKTQFPIIVFDLNLNLQPAGQALPLPAVQLQVEHQGPPGQALQDRPPQGEAVRVRRVPGQVRAKVPPEEARHYR